MRLLLFILSCNLFASAQISFIRTYTQSPPPQNYFYFGSLFSQPIKIKGGGFHFSALPWSPNLHMAYPVDFISISTNPNGAAIWKKPAYSQKTVQMQSGKLLTLFASINDRYVVEQGRMGCISSVNPNGSFNWTKKVSLNGVAPLQICTSINDFIYQNSQVICVGTEQIENVWTNTISTRGFIAVFDTLGTLVNQLRSDLITGGSMGWTGYDKIVAVNGGYLIGDGSGKSLYKLNSNLTLGWAMKFNTQLSLTEAFQLNNGNIFCLFENWFLPDTSGVLACFSPSGALVFANGLPLRARFSGMNKTSDSKFIITGLEIPTQGGIDSSQMIILKVDSNAFFHWGKKLGSAIGISAPNSAGSEFFFSYFDKSLRLQQGHINGSLSCSSTSFSILLPTISLPSQSFTTQLSAGSYSILQGGVYGNLSQTVRDSCIQYLNIEDHNNDKFSLFPNPSKYSFSVEGVLMPNDYRLTIINLEGEVVLESRLNERIDVAHLSAGLYVVLIIGQGRVIDTKKLLIDH